MKSVVFVLLLVFASLACVVADHSDTHIRLLWSSRTPIRRITISYQAVTSQGIPSSDEVEAVTGLSGWRTFYNLKLPSAGRYRIRVRGRVWRLFPLPGSSRLVTLLDRTFQVGPSTKTVEVTAEGINSMKELPDFSSYAVQINVYDPVIRKFQESRTVAVSRLPAFLQLEVGSSYLLRLSGVKPNGETLILKDQVESLIEGEEVLPFQQESIQSAEEDRSSSDSVSVTLTLPTIAGHLQGVYDTWIFQYRLITGSFFDVVRIPVSDKQTFKLQDIAKGTYQFELKLVDSATGNEASAGGIQFYTIADITRSVACFRVDYEPVDIFLHQWSTANETWELIDRMLGKNCSAAPFQFTSLSSGYYSTIVGGNVTRIIYFHHVDPLPSNVELGYHVIQVAYNVKDLPVSAVSVHYYPYDSESQRFLNSFPASPRLSLRVTELPAVVTYAKEYFHGFAVMAHAMGIQHCIAIRGTNQTGIVPYQYEGLTYKSVKSEGYGHVVTLPAVEKNLIGMYDQWKLTIREISSPVRRQVITSTTDTVVNMGRVAAGLYELQLMLSNSRSGAEALAGDCIMQRIGNGTLEVPCSASINEVVTIYLFQWYTELQRWDIQRVLRGVRCNGTAVTLHGLLDASFSYAVVGADTKTVYSRHTDPPPGGQHHAFIDATLSEDDIGIMDSYRADVFRYDPKTGHFDTQHPEVPYRSFAVDNYPTVISLNRGYYYVVFIYGSTLFLNHCLGVHRVDLSNGEFDIPSQDMSIVDAKWTPGDLGSGVVTLELTLPPIASHLQGKYDTWTLHFRSVPSSSRMTASVPVKSKSLVLRDFMPGTYEYLLKLHNSADGREAFAGDCSYYVVGNTSVEATCPPGVLEYVDVHVYLWSVSEKKWEIVRQQYAQPCDKAPFIYEALPAGDYSTVVCGNITRHIYRQEFIPPQNDSMATAVFLSNRNVYSTSVDVHLYRYNTNTRSFGGGFPVKPDVTHAADAMPVLAQVEPGAFYFSLTETSVNGIGLCVSSKPVDLTAGGFVPYQEDGITREVIAIKSVGEMTVTIDLVMPDVADHLTGLFDTWILYYRNVFESRTYNNRSAAVSSIASMQLPPLPVGLYDYQLLLYNSTDHSEAFAGQCGFYEIKAINVTCPVNISETVNVYLYMWSAHDEQWDLAGLRRDTFCNQDSVTFPVIGKTQYITVVRGSESRKIYVQHEEADGVSIKNKCQLLDEDEEMVKYVPAIVSHSVEIFNYEPSTGRFGTSFPSQPTLRRENVILPTLVCGLHGSLTFASATGVDALGRLHHVGEEVVDMLPGPIPIYEDDFVSADVVMTASGSFNLILGFPSVPKVLEGKYNTWKLVYKMNMWRDYVTVTAPVERTALTLADVPAGVYEYALALVNSNTQAEVIFKGFRYYKLAAPESHPTNNTKRGSMTVPLSELEARSVDVQLFEWDATSYWWKRIAEVKGVMTGASVKDHIFTGLDADKAHSYLVFSVSGGITTVHFQGHEEPIPGQYIGDMSGTSVRFSQPFDGVTALSIPEAAPNTVNILQYRQLNYQTQSVSAAEEENVLLKSNTTYLFYMQRFVIVPPLLFPPSPYLEVTSPEIDGSCVLGCQIVI